ncbi:MAG: type I restriction enzyme HsdR N-terminal domain-containing protein [Candidatus Cryptobacteroides sp.]
MQTVWDPLRKKEVALTPEEQVRQSFIVYLRDSLGVPTSLMNSEVFLKYGQKPFRADILVFDRRGEPLMLVECKRADVVLDEQVLRQALNYHAVLNIRYLVLTNGKTSYLYGRNKGGEFESLRTFPKYEEMICR